MSLGKHTNASIEEGMVRHMVLNSLRSYRVKFGDEFPFLVDCCLRGIVAKEFKVIAKKRIQFNFMFCKFK
jgi:hypothetical protein